jgi:hypothetical protein
MNQPPCLALHCPPPLNTGFRHKKFHTKPAVHDLFPTCFLECPKSTHKAQQIRQSSQCSTTSKKLVRLPRRQSEPPLVHQDGVLVVRVNPATRCSPCDTTHHLGAWNPSPDTNARGPACLIQSPLFPISMASHKRSKA